MSETKAGYVELKERARSGKSWKLKLGGQWYSVSNRANLDGVEQDVYVEYRLGGFNGNDGKWITTVDAIRPAQAPAGFRPPQGSGSGPIAASKLASAHWDDSALRFISNVVGTAIQVQAEEMRPEDLITWALAAEQALLSLGKTQGPAQTPSGSGVNPGSAPKDPLRREPGQDDEPPFFDDSDALRF